MLTKRFLVSFAATIATAAAQYKGFNYASTNADGSVAYQSDFEQQFNAAKSLVGASGFTSARLYTMIQEGTTNTPIEAIPAAINTGTTLLLGLWASAGQAHITNEIQALSAALSTYGSSLTNLIAGISVGSEDLYRETPIGIASNEGPGASAATLASYIEQTRAALRQAKMSNLLVGHVDTWTAWVNSSNAQAISSSDFLGLDAYPYYEKTDTNPISKGGSLFDAAYDATNRVAAGKEVWITETGWPLSGAASGQAIASVQNAKKYWDEVACKYMGKVNTWWFTLYDQGTSPAFGIVGSTLGSQPAFNLHCPKHAAHSPAQHSDHGPKHSSDHGPNPTKSHRPHTATKSHRPHTATKSHHPHTATRSHRPHTATKTHHHHHHSHTARPGNHHKSHTHTSPAKPSPTGDANAKAKSNSDPSSGAGILQPSILLMITMLAFWCL